MYQDEQLHQTQKTIKRRIEKHHGGATKSNLNRLPVELKQDLGVESEKLCRKKTIQERRYINRMFKVAPKKVYRSMREGGNHKIINAPEQSEMETFWKATWNIPTQHNDEAPWLKDMKEEYCRNVTPKIYEITDEILDKVLSKLANDKPGRERPCPRNMD